MRVGRTAGRLLPLLLVAAACGSRFATRPAVESVSNASAPAADQQPPGEAAPSEAFLQQQLAERDREIERLRNDVHEARAREEEMRDSLRRATDGGSVKPNAAASGLGSASATAAVAAPHPDAVLSALQAALSQEQERRQLVETQLNRLKEETSAAFGGPRVPEADFLAVKQELVTLQQALANERAARERLSQEGSPPPGAPAPTPPPAQTTVEAADLRVRLQTLQEQKDAIEQSLNRNLAASQQRVAALEQELGAARSAAAAAAPEVAATPSASSAGNPNLRAQLDAERHRTEDLAAKLKIALRINDLIFKIQAQQNKTPPPAPKKRRH